MLSHTAKMILSCSLSLFSIVLYLKFKNRERRYSCFAMMASTCADLFMTDTFHMGSFSTYPGAVFFITNHILYIISFVGASKKKKYQIFNKGFIAGVIVCLTAIIALTLLMLVKTGSVQSMYFPLLFYLIIISINVCLQYSYAVNEKGKRYFLIAGMTLFLISDFVIFMPMLNISPEYNDVVWACYVPAQLLCILFNSDFISKNSMNNARQ